MAKVVLYLNNPKHKITILQSEFKMTEQDWQTIIEEKLKELALVAQVDEKAVIQNFTYKITHAAGDADSIKKRRETMISAAVTNIKNTIEHAHLNQINAFNYKPKRQRKTLAQTIAKTSSGITPPTIVDNTSNLQLPIQTHDSIEIPNPPSSPLHRIPTEDIKKTTARPISIEFHLDSYMTAVLLENNTITNQEIIKIIEDLAKSANKSREEGIEEFSWAIVINSRNQEDEPTLQQIRESLSTAVETIKNSIKRIDPSKESMSNDFKNNPLDSSNYPFLLNAMAQNKVATTIGAALIVAGIALAVTALFMLPGGAPLVMAIAGLLSISTPAASIGTAVVGASIAALTTGGLGFLYSRTAKNNDPSPDLSVHTNTSNTDHQQDWINVANRILSVT